MFGVFGPVLAQATPPQLPTPAPTPSATPTEVATPPETRADNTLGAAFKRAGLR